MSLYVALVCVTVAALLSARYYPCHRDVYLYYIRIMIRAAHEHCRYPFIIRIRLRLIVIITNRNTIIIRFYQYHWYCVRIGVGVGLGVGISRVSGLIVVLIVFISFTRILSMRVSFIVCMCAVSGINFNISSISHTLIARLSLVIRNRTRALPTPIFPIALH